MKNIIFIVLFIISNIAWAQDEPQIPGNCGSDGFDFQNKLLVFNSDNKPIQRIFILHNISPGIVMLAHDKIDPGASAGWQSKLDKDKWSMVAVNQQGFSFGCMLYSPPNIGPADCASVLAVCAMPSELSIGGFWVAENNTLGKILAAAQARGIKM